MNKRCLKGDSDRALFFFLPSFVLFSFFGPLQSSEKNQKLSNSILAFEAHSKKLNSMGGWHAFELRMFVFGAFS